MIGYPKLLICFFSVLVIASVCNISEICVSSWRIMQCHGHGLDKRMRDLPSFGELVGTRAHLSIVFDILVRMLPVAGVALMHVC